MGVWCYQTECSPIREKRREEKHQRERTDGVFSCWIRLESLSSATRSAINPLGLSNPNVNQLILHSHSRWLYTSLSLASLVSGEGDSHPAAEGKGLMDRAPLTRRHADPQWDSCALSLPQGRNKKVLAKCDLAQDKSNETQRNNVLVNVLIVPEGNCFILSKKTTT